MPWTHLFCYFKVSKLNFPLQTIDRYHDQKLVSSGPLEYKAGPVPVSKTGFPSSQSGSHPRSVHGLVTNCKMLTPTVCPPKAQSGTLQKYNSLWNISMFSSSGFPQRRWSLTKPVVSLVPRYKSNLLRNHLNKYILSDSANCTIFSDQ